MMTSVSITDGYGAGAYRQLTGCFDPSRYRKFDPQDAGGAFQALERAEHARSVRRPRRSGRARQPARQLMHGLRASLGARIA